VVGQLVRNCSFFLPGVDFVYRILGWGRTTPIAAAVEAK
jgi:hypothetical protein